MGTAVACMLLAACFVLCSFDLLRIRKELKQLRTDYDSLANFSLKHIQDKQSHE